MTKLAGMDEDMDLMYKEKEQQVVGTLNGTVHLFGQFQSKLISYSLVLVSLFKDIYDRRKNRVIV